MADYLVTGEQMTAIADAIRANTGSKAGVVFPEGFTSKVSEMMHFSHSDRATICKKLVESAVLNSGSGCNACRVYVNDTDSADDYAIPIPARSFFTVVGGNGNHETEAQAIYDVKPDGLRAFGGNAYSYLIQSESIGLYPCIETYLDTWLTVPAGGLTEDEMRKADDVINKYYSGLGIGEDAVGDDVKEICNKALARAAVKAVAFSEGQRPEGDRKVADYRERYIFGGLAFTEEA